MSGGFTRLGAEDLFDLAFLRSARLSPDGRHIAYGLSRTGDEEHFEIWIKETTGSQERRLPYHGNARAPRWSPDGRQIAFNGDGRLYVVEFPSLVVSEPLTPAHLSLEGSPTWAPDGQRLAVSLLERHMVEGPRRLASNGFRSDGRGFIDAFSQCIYEVDRVGGTPRCLTPTEKMCSQPEWSPCGRHILFLATDYAFPLGQFKPRLLTVETRSGEIAEVLGRRWHIEGARWLPGGERIAVAAACDSTLIFPVISLWVVDFSGNNAQLRTPGMAGNIGFRTHHDMPALDLTQDNTLTIIDERTAFATVQKGGSVEIWRIALEGESAVERVLTGERACIVLDANAAADTLLYAVTDLRSPTELWNAALDGSNAARLTALNDAVLARWPPVEIERLDFESADGTKIEAWFMAHSRRKGPLPTVLFIHGGPFSSTGYAFRYDFLMLAAQGFGIVFANFRGSSGYGESFVRAIVGDWCGRAYPDHMGAVDAAVARGCADPNRLGVWGPSYGGSATCWIVGHTHRFKAAVAEAAGTNLTTRYYLGDARELYVRDLGGRPHEIPDVYRACSPITYAHRCTTPTMLLHGEDDLRCPISEAEQFHTVLRDVGCTTELFRIPNCSHLGDSVGPLSARRSQNEALISWFQQHL